MADVLVGEMKDNPFIVGEVGSKTFAYRADDSYFNRRSTVVNRDFEEQRINFQIREAGDVGVI